MVVSMRGDTPWAKSSSFPRHHNNDQTELVERPRSSIRPKARQASCYRRASPSFLDRLCVRGRMTPQDATVCDPSVFARSWCTGSEARDSLDGARHCSWIVRGRAAVMACPARAARAAAASRSAEGARWLHRGGNRVILFHCGATCAHIFGVHETRNHLSLPLPGAALGSTSTELWTNGLRSSSNTVTA